MTSYKEDLLEIKTITQIIIRSQGNGNSASRLTVPTKRSETSGVKWEYVLKGGFTSWDLGGNHYVETKRLIHMGALYHSSSCRGIGYVNRIRSRYPCWEMILR